MSGRISAPAVIVLAAAAAPMVALDFPRRPEQPNAQNNEVLSDLAKRETRLNVGDTGNFGQCLHQESLIIVQIFYDDPQEIVGAPGHQEATLNIGRFDNHGFEDSQCAFCLALHPLGASGARVVTTLISALYKNGLKRGVASLCIGGGEATALAVELI